MTKKLIVKKGKKIRNTYNNYRIVVEKYNYIVIDDSYLYVWGEKCE